MKKIFSLALAIVLILHAFSISAFCEAYDIRLENKVGISSDSVKVVINQEYTFNFHVFTEEDFPGIDIEKIEQKPTGLILNEDGTIGVDPAFDINESDIEYVRTNLIIHLKDTDDENIGQKINQLLAFPIVDYVKRIYIHEQDDGHLHIESEVIRGREINYPEKDYAETEWFTYCLLCGKEISREIKRDYTVVSYDRVIISLKNANANIITDYTVKDFPGIDVKSVENHIGVLVVFLNTDTFEEGQDTINSIRQMDFVRRAVFYYPTTTQSNASLGDVNFDNKLDVADARETLRRSIGLSANCFNNNADMNKDGKVTVADARTILRMAIGLEYIPSAE